MRTKIVATIGPANAQPRILAGLFAAGVNVCRINFGHGNVENQRRLIRAIRRAAVKQKKSIALLADLSGSKLRIGEVRDDSALIRGKTVRILRGSLLGDGARLSLNRPQAIRQFRKGQLVYLDDGTKKLRVLSVTDKEILLRVLVGGPIRSNIGVAILGTTLDFPVLSAKDLRDLRIALKEGVDAIALSFVKRAEDIRRVRKFLPKTRRPFLVAKIETPAALNDIDRIIHESDGIMIARGDLGLTVPPAEVPHIQKMLIAKALTAAKPVITATQMLESMVHDPVPTRAEVSDVTNAIFDGTDAVMLSSETARGNYPREAVRVMRTIIQRTDPHVALRDFHGKTVSVYPTTDAVSNAVVHTAIDVGACAIAVFTESGSTARHISRHRPQQPILAFSPHPETLRHLAFSGGVTPIKTRELSSVEEAVTITQKTIKKLGVGKRGQRFVLSAGIPFRKAGTTDLLYVGHL